MSPGPRRPLVSGALLAVASAVAFGATIPVLGWAGASVGAFSTAALLYAGASAAAVAQKAIVAEAGAPLGRSAVGPLLLMSIAGACAAPSLLAWGIAQTGPVTGGLLLNLEAVWTVVLARLVFGEFLGRRVYAAVGLMVAGGCLLAVNGQAVVPLHPLGVAAVAGAALAWAVDNTASRRLSELRPLTVVALKGALGSALSLALAWGFDEPLPDAWRAAVLLAAGATGYGASLRLYLLAQRKIGAARTGSVFALAPFIGAGLGLVLFPAQLTWAVGLAALCFGSAVALHLSERHAHRHRHDRLDHDHPHRHDDGHHTHTHPSTQAEHSHPHHHEPIEHVHEHGLDVHHGHTHDH